MSFDALFADPFGAAVLKGILPAFPPDPPRGELPGLIPAPPPPPLGPVLLPFRQFVTAIW